jgi:undecaprenyl-diphosphatase
MSIIAAIILGIVEGITEFLPVSSTGHLTIAEKLMGFKIDDPGITAFTAIIQIGAILATIVYFWKDIVRIVAGFIRGIFIPRYRAFPEYRFGWAVILGSIPIAIIGLAFKHQIETSFRSLWVVAIALVVWSVAMWLGDHFATQRKDEKHVTWKDTFIIGAAQCLALVPGVSRSGATMSAGLFRGFDRVTVTRLSFFLAIPALVAAGGLETVSKAGDISKGIGWTPTITATIVSFFVAYAAIAWLLKFIARHSFNVFIVYRVVVGIALVALLATGVISAT